MIRDLQGGGGTVIPPADVLVIGAGIAGLLVATRIAAQGKRVIVFESGGEHQAEETHPFNEVEQLRAVYAGAEHGRFRCLGGTSTRWGGAMIPLLRADMEQDSAGTWPINYSDLSNYIPELERIFSLPGGKYECPDIALPLSEGGQDFIPRLAKWPPFRKRNTSTLFSSDIRKDSGPEIWLNATATGFRLAPDGKLEEVEASSLSGDRVKVRANEVVIAAGAIESTRILLLVERETGMRHYTPHDILGRYFHDHLSVNVAEVIPKNRAAMNRIIGFRFEQGGMRNLRFEPAESVDVRSSLAPCFAHIGFQAVTGGGFDTIREIYRLIQQRRFPGAAIMARLAAGAPWLARAVWWRFVEQRLLFPDDANFELHMVIEQTPRHDNRIFLSSARVDQFGQPLAVIDWSVSADDAARLASATGAFVKFWRTSVLDGLAELRPYAADTALERLTRGGGIYHPGGSTRMGRSISDGVVDSDLRCFGIPNLSVAATSTFPTGGGANPTMMLMLAGLRLADRLSGGRGVRL